MEGRHYTRTCAPEWTDSTRARLRASSLLGESVGTIPQLRAGIHAGNVVTTWVGEARKDLAFHGDTLDVTARLEQMCKELGARCLVSEFVHDQVEFPPYLQARSVGETDLRGRSTAMRLFAVEQL